MKKAMLSQPMGGKTDEEIIETRERAMKALKEKGFEVVNTLFTDEWHSMRIWKNAELFRFRCVFWQNLLKT